MTDSSIYSEIAQAIPVVIGGLLAVGGGVIAQIVTHILTVKREHRNLRRERLESLVKALYAHQFWLDDKFDALLFRDEAHNAPSPLNEARMIQTLHFPELAKEIYAISEKFMPLLQFIGDQRVLRMKDLNAWVETWNLEPYREGYALYMEAINAATVKCRGLLGS